MNIGLLTHQYPGARGGGIGTYSLELAAALGRAGHAVHLFTFTLPAGVVRPAGVSIHEVPDLAQRAAENAVPPALAGALAAGTTALYRLALAWLLCDAARAFHRAAAGGRKLDLLEAPEYEALALPLLLEPEPDLPVVTHLHLCSAIAAEGNCGSAAPADPDAAMIHAFEFGAIALADARCAPTQDIVRRTQRVLGSPCQARVIPHPMALPASPPSAVPAQGAVLFVGRLEPRKGTDLMPGAFNHFLARNPDAHIRLVGSDTQWSRGANSPPAAAPDSRSPGEAQNGKVSVRARLTAALDPAVRDRVHFLGEQSPAVVAREFAACRFSICPSLSESFGYVVAESLIAGRPVAVTADIAAAEVAGEAGVTFPSGDALGLSGAMERLWRDHALCQALGERAYARACRIFSPAQTIDARAAFYGEVREELLAHGRAPLAQRLAALSPQDALAVSGSLATLADPTLAAPAMGSPGMRLLELMNRLAPDGGARVALYGAGRHTARLLAQRALWESRGHRVTALVDDHPRFAPAPGAPSPTHLGLPVFSRTAAETLLRPGDHLVLSTDTFQDQFWGQTAPLRARGIHVHRLYP